MQRDKRTLVKHNDSNEGNNKTVLTLHYRPVVMDMGMAPHDGSRVWVRNFLPVTFPYPFGRVMGM